MDIFVLFFKRYLFSKRGGAIIRTMARLCWLATLIGVFSLVVVASVMNGFNRSIREKLLGVEPHISIQGSADDLAQIRNGSDSKKFSEVTDFYEQDIILRTIDGKFSAGVARGMNESAIEGFFKRINKMKYSLDSSAPDSAAYSNIRLEDREIMIGSDLARDLNLFEGDELLMIPPETLLAPVGEALKFARVRVAYIFTTEFSEIDSRLIFFKYSGVAPLFASPASHKQGLLARLVDPDQAQNMKRKILNGAKDPKSISIETWEETNKALFFALKLEKVAMTTFLSLSILITCFSLITVLVMLISQKRKEIGLLMAIGFSELKTKKLFLSLGLLLSGLGLFIGLALGLFVSFVIDKYPIDILPDIYYDSALPAEINFVFIAWVAVFCLFIAFLAAYLPVRLYMKYSPSENLRLFAAE